MAVQSCLQGALYAVYAQVHACQNRAWACQHPPNCAGSGCYSPAHIRPAASAQASIRWCSLSSLIAVPPVGGSACCFFQQQGTPSLVGYWGVGSTCSAHGPACPSSTWCTQIFAAARLSGLLQAIHAGLCARGTAHLLHVVQPQLGRIAIPLVGGHHPLQLLQALHEGHRCRALLTHRPIEQRNHIPAEHRSPGVCPGHGLSHHLASCQQGKQLTLCKGSKPHMSCTRTCSPAQHDRVRGACHDLLVPLQRLQASDELHPTMLTCSA